MEWLQESIKAGALNMEIKTCDLLCGCTSQVSTWESIAWRVPDGSCEPFVGAKVSGLGSTAFLETNDWALRLQGVKGSKPKGFWLKWAKPAISIPAISEVNRNAQNQAQAQRLRMRKLQEDVGLQ